MAISFVDPSENINVRKSSSVRGGASFKTKYKNILLQLKRSVILHKKTLVLIYIALFYYEINNAVFFLIVSISMFIKVEQLLFCRKLLYL